MPVSKGVICAKRRIFHFIRISNKIPEITEKHSISGIYRQNHLLYTLYYAECDESKQETKCRKSDSSQRQTVEGEDNGRDQRLHGFGKTASGETESLGMSRQELAEKAVSFFIAEAVLLFC